MYIFAEISHEQFDVRAMTTPSSYRCRLIYLLELSRGEQCVVVRSLLFSQSARTYFRQVKGIALIDKRLELIAFSLMIRVKFG